MSETALTRFRPTHAAAYAAALAVVLAVAVIAFPSLYYPFGRDQGIHAYIAKLAGDGYVVYRDVFNVKPPLTTVVHGLAQALFGETMRAIRLMDLLIVAATALMLQSLVARYLKSLWLGGVAAVAFATGHYSNNYWHTAQTDGWTSLFVVAAMLLYCRSLDAHSARARALILCAAGAVMGLAFWLKYTIVVVLLVFPSVHLALRLPRRRILADGAAVTAGFLACVLLGIAAMAAIGALPAFLDIQDFMRSYVAHGRVWWEFALAPLLVLVRARLATALAMVGFYALYKTLSRSARHRPEAVALLVWTAAAWGAALLQGKVFVYHLLPLYPPLAIAAAVGVHALAGVLARFGGRRTAALAAAAACTLIVWISNVPTNYRALGPALGGGERALRDHWDNGDFAHSDFDTRDNLALVDYLKQRTLPCDSLYVWGYEPVVYFLSERRMVSRFLYNFPMFTAYYRQAYRDELMAALAADTPAVFVVQHEDRTPHVSVHDHDSAEILEQFGALKSFLAERYRLRDRVARFDVYYRSDIDPAATRHCPATAQR
jgi:hypothetical protein